FGLFILFFVPVHEPIMASDAKAAGSMVTKEIESRLKETPEHLFEVFLEIREPVDNEKPKVLIKYPNDFSDDGLQNVTNFAYPCKTPLDEQSEHFAFVILDTTGTLFRFGYCRRSNRESTCLCIISFYPWFEIFYNILNDLSQIINSKSLKDSSQSSILTADMEQFLSSLYNYKLMSNEEFYKNEGKEIIEINTLSKSYTYTRSDPRKLPSMLSSRNFTVMVSRLGPEIMLRLFSHLLFERRLLFVSSKLFHLTACAYGCSHLIYPMHWQSIFLPILPSSMTWTAQCTAPYIIGMHSSVFSTLNMDELGDVVIVKIDERKIESQYDDLNNFPKHLIRSMKKGIQQSSQLAGDHLARIFLRAMAFSVGNYANGFIIKNDKSDFDRDRYLEPYLGSHVHSFMSAVAHTQMFEQFSRYRTYAQLQRETDVDEFDLEVKNLQKLQQSKKPFQFWTREIFLKAREGILNFYFKNKTNVILFDLNDVIKRVNTSKIRDPIALNYAREIKSIHQSSSPDLLNEKSIPYGQMRSKEDIFSSEPRLINQDQISSSSSSSSPSSTPELERHRSNPLINLEIDDNDNPLLPSPITLNVINTSVTPSTQRQTPQIDSKIKQLQDELQYKVQTFDNKRIDPRNEYGQQQQKEIKKLVEQFDPLDDSNKIKTNSNEYFSTIPIHFRSDDKLSSNTSDRHRSIYETIPTNYVNNVLQNIQTIYGTTSRSNLRSTYSIQSKSQENNFNHFSPMSTAPANLFPTKTYKNITDDASLSFDPLAPSKEKILYPNIPSSSSTAAAASAASQTNESNLIDFN
ncbi:unnamed protein product, partial [Rotaria sordida]